jgi:hypothetical protein
MGTNLLFAAKTALSLHPSPHRYLLRRYRREGNAALYNGRRFRQTLLEFSEFEVRGVAHEPMVRNFSWTFVDGNCFVDLICVFTSRGHTGD